VIPVVIRSSDANADIRMRLPSLVHHGQHDAPGSVMRRSCVPSAAAVKMVSSWKLPPARVNRSLPSRVPSAMAEEDEPGPDEGVASDDPFADGDDPPPLVHDVAIDNKASNAARAMGTRPRLLLGSFIALAPST
jgi:hypothetical protein